MINNNPYNIPEKKPLAPSKIISQTNSSRHSSTYLQNRNSSEAMYSSGIFVKNQSVNGGCDQSFFQSIKQPLSPHHHKYPKTPSTVQFIPAYNMPSMRPPENHFFPVSVPKQNNVQKSLFELREKLDRMQKRLEAKQKMEQNLNQIQNKKQQNLLENQSLTSLTQDSSNNSNGLRQLLTLMIEETLEIQNKKIWQKLAKLEENTMISLNNQLNQKITLLEETVLRLQSDRPQDEQLLSRLKTIEKTIRQMGEDIHLINDKEESLSSKVQIDLPAIKNQVKALRGIEKKVMDTEKRMSEMKEQIDDITKRLKSLQVLSSTTITLKIKEIESKLQSLKGQEKDIKPSFQRYLSEPCILKYIQKYQVSKPYTGNSYSSSTKQGSTEQIIINDITYFIDQEGYLLDNDRYYLINSIKNDRIRLDRRHIDILREKKILI